MEIEEESSRPSVGFPLGLALLLILLLSMCCFFTCCIHWNKLRSLFGLSTDHDHDHHHDHLHHQHQDDSLFHPHKPQPPQQEGKKKEAESLPVVMPGDQFPKFIAVACPPLLLNVNVNVNVNVDNNNKLIPSFSVPFYQS
ncbi:hydroxyproline-rich glycoprotein family protein [Euphorbia peplus]|nr:hydroxyproline-rich glycoprotein family protein [Euphorbia peplus]